MATPAPVRSSFVPRLAVVLLTLGAWTSAATASASLGADGALPRASAARSARTPLLLAKGGGGGYHEALGHGDKYDSKAGGGGGKKFDAYGKNDPYGNLSGNADPYSMKSPKTRGAKGGGEDALYGGGGGGRQRAANRDSFAEGFGNGKKAKAAKSDKNGRDPRYDDDRGNSDREDHVKPYTDPADNAGSGNN